MNDNEVELLHELVRLNAQLIRSLKSSVEDLYKRIGVNFDSIGLLIEVAELNSEIRKEIREKIEQDQVEMADDFTEQLYKLEQGIQRLNALQAPPEE